MRYRIRHRTTYRYERPVSESFNEIRLQPMAGAGQTILDFDLSIDPPATVISFRDYYGNAVHDFGVPYLHQELSIEATSDVVTHADEDEQLAGPGPDDPDGSPPLRELAEDAAVVDEHAEFLGVSQYIVLEDASAALARELLSQDAEVSALGFFRRAAEAVAERLHYRIGATTVESSVAEVLAGGSGVCQDFAHVLISLCRHAGLPARYVSGYLGSVPEATASHAWVEAFVPPYGWLGIDPTHSRHCTGAYVTVGVGRDYADVAVLRGTYQGRAAATLEVYVQSESLGSGGGVAELAPQARRRSALVATQNLGAMRRFRRSPASLTQTLGGMTQTMTLDELPPPRRQAGQQPQDDAPMQQPRQQQQGRA